MNDEAENKEAKPALKNSDALKKEIKKAVDQITAFKTDRTHINEKIAEVRARMEANGVSKKAFDMALSYMNMDADAREGFDAAYTIVREAIGLPMEPDLFTPANGGADGK